VAQAFELCFVVDKRYPSFNHGYSTLYVGVGTTSSRSIGCSKRYHDRKTELPLNLGKTACEYLQDLRQNLEMVQSYAKEHAERAQGKYVARYNLRAREKSFEIGDEVIILTPDSTSSKLFFEMDRSGSY